MKTAQTCIRVYEDDLFGYRIDYAAPVTANNGEIEPSKKEDKMKPNIAQEIQAYKVPLSKKGKRQKRETPFVCIMGGQVKNDIKSGVLPQFSIDIDNAFAAYSLWEANASEEWYEPKRSARNPNPQPGWHKMCRHWSFNQWDERLTNMNDPQPLIPDIGDYCKHVVLIGVSLPIQVLEYWSNRSFNGSGVKVTLIDNHQKAITDLGLEPGTTQVWEQKDLEIYVDTNMSCCQLAWSVYNPMDECPNIFDYLHDRLSHTNEMRLSYEINLGISQLKVNGMRKAGLYGVFNELDHYLNLSADNRRGMIKMLVADRVDAINQIMPIALQRAQIVHRNIGGCEILVMEIGLPMDGDMDFIKAADVAQSVLPQSNEIDVVAVRNSRGNWGIEINTKSAKAEYLDRDSIGKIQFGTLPSQYPNANHLPNHPTAVAGHQSDSRAA